MKLAYAFINPSVGLSKTGDWIAKNGKIIGFVAGISPQGKTMCFFEKQSISDNYAIVPVSSPDKALELLMVLLESNQKLKTKWFNRFGLDLIET